LCETTLHYPTVRRFPTVPPALPPGAAFDEHIYSCDAGTRPYKLFVPSGYVGRPLPLVVMLHGCTQSPDDFAAGTQLNELAESQGFLVVYPGQLKSANPSKCWNWFNQGDQSRGGGEPAVIEGITRRVMQNFAVDATRVYVAGLSAGGAMAAIMGSEYPELYAAICVHSGLARGVAKDIPSAFAAMRQGGTEADRPTPRPVPTIVFHGDSDTTVHPENGRQVIAQSKAASELQATTIKGRVPSGREYTRTVQTDATGRVVLEHWSLHGAGHAWSGGSPNGSYTDASGPNASREMMRFFLLHKHE
jgi:poly(hydroxyalkanoate) depolymerase family esterase